jgi:cytochrome c-type biogenesis protein CcmE
MVGRSARVHGYVAESSIERDLEGKRVRFAVQNNPPHAGGPVGQTLSVVYESLETPDLFKDGAEVVVEGQLVMAQGQTVFQADNVMAKCPSKFEAQGGPASEPSIKL